MRILLILLALAVTSAASAQEHRASCGPGKIDIRLDNKPRVMTVSSLDETAQPQDQENTLVVERSNPAMHSVIWSHGPGEGEVTVECGSLTYVRIRGNQKVHVIMQQAHDLEIFWGNGATGTVESVLFSDKD